MEVAAEPPMLKSGSNTSFLRQDASLRLLKRYQHSGHKVFEAISKSDSVSKMPEKVQLPAVTRRSRNNEASPDVLATFASKLRSIRSTKDLRIKDAFELKTSFRRTNEDQHSKVLRSLRTHRGENRELTRRKDPLGSSIIGSRHDECREGGLHQNITISDARL